MQQDVTAEKYPINSIQKTDMIGCFARRGDNKQIPITKIDSIAWA